ncbi:unnamed protein product [Closterium sp. NIES-53]
MAGLPHNLFPCGAFPPPPLPHTHPPELHPLPPLPPPPPPFHPPPCPSSSRGGEGGRGIRDVTGHNRAAPILVVPIAHNIPVVRNIDEVRTLGGPEPVAASGVDTFPLRPATFA